MLEAGIGGGDMLIKILNVFHLHIDLSLHLYFDFFNIVMFINPMEEQIHSVNDSDLGSPSSL